MFLEEYTLYAEIKQMILRKFPGVYQSFQMIATGKMKKIFLYTVEKSVSRSYILPRLVVISLMQQKI